VPHNVLTYNVVQPISEVKAKYNTRIKYYGNIKKVTVFSRQIFVKRNLEVMNPNSRIRKIKRSNLENDEIREDSIKRAKDKAYDICYANKFDYFITLTLDKEKIDRYDKNVILKKFTKWLNNRVERSSFKYIIFPEFHKDGAIHFHGLCSGELKLVESGKKTIKGQTIYNSDSWKYGFSTVIKLEGPYDRVVNYIVKYISKGKERVFGKHYLSGGKDLKREVPTEYMNVSYEAIKADKEYYIADAHLGVKYLTLNDN
jgi:hypothetical protein